MKSLSLFGLGSVIVGGERFFLCMKASMEDVMWTPFPERINLWHSSLGCINGCRCGRELRRSGEDIMALIGINNFQDNNNDCSIKKVLKKVFIIMTKKLSKI